MTSRQYLAEAITVTPLIDPSRVGDETPAVVSTPIDRSTDRPHTRTLLVLSAFETNAANTGGTWTVEQSATSGGAYTAATLGAQLAATPAAAGNDVQTVDVLPSSDKPWLRVTFTGADSSTEVDITALLLRCPAVV